MNAPRDPLPPVSRPAAPLSPALACFHCGLPVPADAHWPVVIEGREQLMCCPGCAAVAQSIVAAGLEDFYRQRTSYSANGGEQCLVPEALAEALPVYDSPELAGQFATGDGGVGEGTFTIEGLRCAACVWLIERQLTRLPGVLTVELNVARERVLVRWNSALCQPSRVIGALRAIGYVAYPYDANRHGEQLERAEKKLFRQWFVAGLSMMQVMNYVVVFYLDKHDAVDAEMTALMQWASLVLTLPAVLYSAQPFFAGAWRDLRNRMAGMDVPVALGIAAAFAGSVWATVTGVGDVWYDSVTMFIFLLLGSRYLELMARRKAASALERLQHALPASATLLAAWPEPASQRVPAARLQEGDVILVRPGETVPADAVIIDGASELDLALLTGESRPVALAVGGLAPGGAVNVAQPLVARVARPVADSTLSLLVKLVEKAGAHKPRLALWADRVAAWFVAALLALAVGVFVAWQMIDPSRAWPIAIAVLVVSCPCALSLATPSALAAATDRLLRQGALVVRAHVLETMHRATHVVFDKTGTLTLGKPVVRAVVVDPAAAAQARTAVDLRSLALQRAAALEASSAHPLAAAVRAAAAGLAPLSAVTVRSVPGAGLEGVIDGVTWRLGTADFVAGLGAGVPVLPEAADVTPVWLGSAAGILARFDLADGLRPEARAVVAAFRAAGKQVVLLSGDRPEVAVHVGAELGIDAAVGGVLPADKLAYVQRLQAAGAVVAMVGDGINDAAVLRGADVSFAMGEGASLAQMHADCVLLSGRLGTLADVAVCAQQTLAVVRQNLAWASIYNLVAIPAAALGWLNPWLAGVGMAASSALVVLNALRLRRIPRAGTRAMARANALATAPVRGF